MKLLFPSTLIATALLRAPTSRAFAPLSANRHTIKAPSPSQSNHRTPIHLHVGFKDPNEQDTKEAMKNKGKLYSETNKAKKWLSDLMKPEGEAFAPPSSNTQDDTPSAPSEEIGLFGGGAYDISSTTTSKPNPLPVYKPTLRSDLGKSILLTGTYDPTLLRVLNNNNFGSRDSVGGGGSGDSLPNFEFERIVLAVRGEEGAKEAKKRVIGREARYSGLLDKLEIVSEEGLLPDPKRLEGVSSWVVRLEYGEVGEAMPKVAALAEKAEDLKHVIVLVEGMDSMSSKVEGWDRLLEAGSNKFRSTLLAVGSLYDAGAEGKFYHLGSLTGGESTVEKTNVDANAPTMFRGDAYLTLANLLALECTSDKALCAYEYSTASMETIHHPMEVEPKKVFVDGTWVDEEAPDEKEWEGVKYTNRIVRGMRELGFSRLAELDVLLERGVDEYKDYLAAPPPPKVLSPAAKALDEKKRREDELDKKILASLDRQIEEAEAKRKIEEDRKYAEDVHDMARDWAYRQYTLKSLNNEVDDMTELEFIKSVWQQALDEGKKLYAMVNSEEYQQEMERRNKAYFDETTNFIYEGMDPGMRRYREKIIQKIKSQYLDAFVGEEKQEEGAGVEK